KALVVRRALTPGGKDAVAINSQPASTTPELRVGVRRNGYWRFSDGRGRVYNDADEPWSAGLELATLHRLETSGGAIDAGGKGILWGSVDLTWDLTVSAEAFLGVARRIG